MAAVVPLVTGPSVEARVSPGVRIADHATPEAFGVNIGAALGDAAKVTQQIAGAEQEKADTAKLMEAQQQLLDVDSSLLNDPDTGAFAQRGKNAIGLAQRVLPQWDQQAAQITAALPGHLREKFGAFAMSRRTTAADQLARHTLNESDTYYADTAKTTMEKFQSDALTNRTDPAAVDASANGAAQAAQQFALRRGLDPEAYAKAAMSATYRGVLEATVADDPNAAIAKYAQYKPLLNGTDQAAIEKTLQPYLLDTQATSFVDALLGGKAPPAGTLPVAEGAATTPAEAEAIARASVGRMIGLESGGKADATNPQSSATGAGQFLRSTWLDVVKRNFPDVAAGKSDDQIAALRTDPALSRKVTEQYAVENCRRLFAAGLPVTPETAYLCHHFGADGAIALLRAPADTPVAAVVGPKAMAANAKELTGKTVGELMGDHAARAGEARGGYVGPDGKPDWGAMLTAADAIANPNQRKAAVAEVEHRRAIANASEAQLNQAMGDAVFQAAYAAPVGAKPEQYLSPTQLAWAQKENHIETLQAIAKRRATDSLVQTDPVIFDAYRREALANPRQFAARNLLAEAGEKLDTGDLQALTAMQTAIKRGDTAAQADWSNDQQRIVGILRNLGQGDAPLDPNRKLPAANQKGRGTDNASQLPASDPRVAAVGSAYRQALAAYTQAHGKPTPADRDRIAVSVQSNIARDIGDGGWARVVRQQNAADSYGLDVASKVSSKDYQTVQTTLRTRLGREPTEAEVVDLLRRYYSTGTN